jgi:hypothetical protein
VENNIEEDIKILENFINWLKTDFEYNSGEEIKAIEHILSDYKRILEINEVLLKENEELTISNKEIDKECSRLEKKEVELINENEHYTDLIYALKTYYDITEEDLEKCMKNDR